MKNFIVIALVFMMAGCATLATFAPDPMGKSVLPSDIAVDGKTRIANYKMTISKGGEDNTILLHVESSPDSLTIVGLGPLGEPLFSCFMTSEGSEAATCDTLDSKIPADRFLGDMLLVLTPFSVLNGTMGNGFDVVQDDDGNRMITHSGSAFIGIVYANKDQLMDKSMLTHQVYGYSFELSPLSIEVMENE